MAGTKKTKVERFVNWYSNHKFISVIIIIFMVISSAKNFFDISKSLVTSAKEFWSAVMADKVASELEVQEWAKNVNQEKQKYIKQQQTQDLAPLARKRNDEIGLIYQDFLSTLTGILTAYRGNKAANIYIYVPNLPENLYLPESSQYRGVAIFSQNAAWAIFYENDNREEKVPHALKVNFMNGDGTTKGATGIGEIRISFNAENKKVLLSSSGVGRLIVKICLRNCLQKILKSFLHLL
jgi:hypothetical protein